MTTYYVNGSTAADGYGAGNDSTGTGSQATPYATIAKATSVALVGDQVCIKPVAAGAYSEDSGSGYLAMGNATLLYGDPGLISRDGKPVIQAANAAAIRVVYPTATGVARELRDIVVDSQLRASQKGVTLLTDNMTFTRVDWKNQANACWAAPTGAINIVQDGCTTAISNTSTTVFETTSTSNVANITVKGGTYYAPAGAVAVFYWSTSTVSGNIVFQADSSGSMVDFTPSAAPFNIRVQGTVGGLVSITGTKHINTPGGVYLNGPAVTGAVAVTSNTFTGLTAQPGLKVTGLTAASLAFNSNTYSGTLGACAITARSLTVLAIQSNVCTVKAASTTLALWVLCMGTGSPVISNNTLTFEQASQANGGGIQVGTDGVGSGTPGNTSSAAGTKNLGDVSGNALLAQKFTTVAATSSSDATHIAAVQFYLSKNGSPTGNITASLYTDNAGAPGTLVAAGESSVSAASLTTSSATYGFTIVPAAVAAGTSYWFVLSCTGGTTDASNYVKVDYNTTTTSGSLSAGTSVPVWTANTGQCLRNLVYTGIYGVTPTIRNNTLVVSGNPNTLAYQLITVGPTYGCYVYGNYLVGTAYYPIVIKNVRGTTGYVYGNICTLNSAHVSSGAAIYMKSSADIRVYNNTFRISGTSAIPACVQADKGSLNWTNEIVSTNFRVQNNVMLQLSSGGAPVYIIGSGSTTTTAWVSNNLVYTVTPANIYSANGWSAWQALGYDVNSTGPSTDPGLTNITSAAQASDYAPVSAASPVVGVGLNLTASAPLDYNGMLELPQATIGAVGWFTGELTVLSQSATTVYAVVRSIAKASGGAGGLAWNWQTGAYEVYTAANLASYAIGMAQQGATGIWFGNAPAKLPTGRHVIDYRSQAGGSPAENDTAIGTPARVNWLNLTGLHGHEVQPVAMGRMAAAA